jgi:hypothetical protein
MRRIALILLVAGLAACTSTPDVSPDPDPFAEAEPVEGGLYADDFGLYAELPEETPPISSGLTRFLNDEWKRSVSGWSFTTRAIGRWAVRDWNRTFGDSD